LADFDKNGSLDLAATNNGAGTVVTFFNQWNGTFQRKWVPSIKRPVGSK
jgi:hypothetical protein